MGMHINTDQIPEPLFHVALVEPEIPNNTGNIGRICVGLRSRLHIVGKPSFEITDARVKRAGLDYWPHLDLMQHESYDAFLATFADPSRVFLIETTAKKSVYSEQFRPGDVFVFGKETTGINEPILSEYREQVRGLPMLGPIRSQNLANTVSVVLYEGLRQYLSE